MKSLKILLDFDGTCVAHRFPDIGEDIGAVPVLKELVAQGHKLILFTMRSDKDNGQVTLDSDPDIYPANGKYLKEALQWFKSNDIPLYSIQKDRGQENWTSSPKAYGNLIIDDTALGVPLAYPVDAKPYVDWNAVRGLLIDQGILESTLWNTK